MPEVFPLTRVSWIASRLKAGEEGLLDVNRHVMSVYAEPLRAYYLGTQARWLGEPDDVIEGFFADRLGRPDFMTAWEHSGLRLRRWLMNAFGFYLKEQLRRRRRDAVPDQNADEAVAFSGDPVAAVDRAFIVSVVRHALEETRRTCESEGLGPHWNVFHAHFCCETPYAAIAGATRLDPARCVVMARTVRARFQRALRAALAVDDPSGAADAEILALLEGGGR